MTRTKQTWAWLAGGLAAVGAVFGIAYLTSKPAAAGSGGGGGGGTTALLNLAPGNMAPVSVKAGTTITLTAPKGANITGLTVSPTTGGLSQAAFFGLTTSPIPLNQASIILPVPMAGGPVDLIVVWADATGPQQSTISVTAV